MSASVPTWLEISVEASIGSLRLSLDLVPTSGRVAIVGPSGTGKSSFLRILAGLETRISGVVRFGGETWSDSGAGIWREPWERGVGWVPQDALLFPHLSVAENLLYGAPPRADMQEAAAAFRVDHLLDRRPRNLSGGERQRVALVRALLSEPRLLLLDEPFSALDRPLRRELARVLSDWLTTHGLPVVLVSHDEEDAVMLGAERWTLAEGSLRAHG